MNLTLPKTIERTFKCNLQVLLIAALLAPFFSSFSKPTMLKAKALTLVAEKLKDTVPNSKSSSEPARKTRTYRVKPGDTKFSLARAFDVSINSLEAENPHIVNVLKAGDVITVSNAMDPSSMYVIVKGDTKFSLAKNAGITISQLEAHNPNIKNGLVIGQVIHIPKGANNYTAAYVTTVTDSEVNNEDYINYTLPEDNTLYGLSQLAGLKPSEFLILNPHISNDVKRGTTVKMPKTADLSNMNSAPPTSDVAESESPEVIADDPEEITANEDEDVTSPATEEKNDPIDTDDAAMTEPEVEDAYTELSQTINTAEINKIVFLAPDELGNTIVDLKNKVTSSSENPQILRYLDFYKGAQLAIDSISKMGIQAEYNITLLDNLKNSTTSTDALVVPFYDGSGQALRDNLANPNIPVIITANLEDQSGLQVVASSPDKMANQERVIDYAIEKDAHILIISDPRNSNDLGFVESRTSKLDIITTDNVGRFNSDELLKSLKKRGLNMVIIDSKDSNVYLGVTNFLLTKLNDFDIQLAVMDADLIPAESIVSTKRYKILKMIYPSSTPANVSDKEAKFIKRFRKEYEQTPSENAIYGFDIVYDLLLRLAQNDDLTETFNKSITKQFNLKFQYVPTETGYKNLGVYLFQYDPVQGIIEID